MQRALACTLGVFAVWSAVLAQPAAAADPAPADSAPLAVGEVEVVAERDVPQVCVTFNARVERAGTPDLRPWLSVTPEVKGTLAARDRSVCLDGLQHGQSYQVTVAAGLPAADGRTLAEGVSRTVEVPNRRSALAFRGAGYILPRLGMEGLPLRTINVARVRLQILRLPDPAIVEQIHQGRINQELTDNDVGAIVAKAGQEVWKGEMAVPGARNAVLITPFPVDAVVGRLDPGVYVAVASADEVPEKDWASRATQWFLVTDLGLTAVRGDDGLLVYARSVATARPQEGVELRLLARDHSDRATVTTGPDGIARVPADALAGDRPAQVLLARRGGDLAMMDLNGPGDGRPPKAAGALEPPKALDAWISPSRGLYRPGEPAVLTVLVRDGDANAVTGRALAVSLRRPDGVEVDRRTVMDAGAGGAAVSFPIAPNAMTGQWTATVHDGDGGQAIGSARFQVEDVVPPRLTLGLAADRPALEGTEPVAVTLDVRDLYGAPAAGLPGEASLTLRPAESPAPGLSGYRFGPVEKEFPPQKQDLPGFTTGPDGQAHIAVALPRRPDTTRPLEAVLRATVTDIGGRPLTREMVLPVNHQPFAIGIRPRFDGQGVPEGASAAFEVVVVGRDGTPVDKPDLSFDLFEETQDYRWVETNGRWDYETTTKDTRVTGGTLSAAASAPAVVEEPVQAGHYRLEVFDPQTGVASSVRFGAGWWSAAPAAARPDKVDVTVMTAAYKGGDTARVHIRPPYRSEVLVTVADRSVRMALTRTIGPEGAFLDIPVDPAWTAGAYVLATAFPVPEAGQKGALRRAVGLSWLGLDPAPRRLDVALSAPAAAEPRRTLPVTLTVRGAAAGKPAFAVVAAVDDRMLALAPQADPVPVLDPVAYFLGRRGLAVEMRDVYGRLLDTDPAPAPAITLRRVRPGAAVPPRNRQVVSLFSGVLPVGADGTVAVPLELPDFHGRLRVMAAAWSADKLGRADATVTVGERVLAGLALPPALAPGDAVHAPLTIEGPEGAYTARLSATGAVTVAEDAEQAVAIPAGRRATLSGTLKADGAGAGTVRLSLAGPDGLSLEQEWPVRVHGTSGMPPRRQVFSLAEGPRTLGADLAAGLVPGTVTAVLAAGPLADLDLPSLALGLDRPLAGGAEALGSRILSLIALAGGDAPLVPFAVEPAKQRVPLLLGRLLAMQRADGAFSPWNAQGDPDPWLSAFVMDVLGRVRDAGHDVPEPAYRRGMDWLRQQTESAWTEEEQLPARAYIGYVLARAKQADAGAVRFFHESWWKSLPTDLARAHVAAALVLAGETKAGAEAFTGLSSARMVSAALRDHGSALRDEAAVLALMQESGVVDKGRLGEAVTRLGRTVAAVPRTGVQEQAWVALAARGAGRGDAPKLTIDGQPFDSARGVVRRIDLLAAPVVLAGEGRVAVAVTGVPAAPLPAEENGLRLTRSLYTMDGKPVTAGTLRHNELVVVILAGESLEPAERTLAVADPLPAGLVIENVRVGDSGSLGNLAWLDALSPVHLVEYRDDRFAGVVPVSRDKPGFRLAYLARAVLPGDFVQPGAVAEDLERPGTTARTAGGRLTVGGEP
ncbi:uncharacterized protein YfaS (alpha-2-macroglobulin family) [Azospirillum fermentarium]|uniref:alpha-2-macroglobulin family protein n=1 Tax=Azospirillum fermentarium TaxID=1233114 RepID=UPI002225EB34|nr:alpha-2-macroglobulin [Azospirillum fermentarium]MCW2246830.1 uncharacterized protein YfaS (alpha-2-macroglobulin family) [Azospirillum fermentarium]